MTIWREILTYPLENEQVRKELAFVVQYFSSKGCKSCSLLFGWDWGIKYYGESDSIAEIVEFSQVEEKVAQVEAAELGSLGNDNLYVSVGDIHFRFCDDSDIHLQFSSSNEDVEFFYQRWKELGYQPAEWLKNQVNGPGERIRFN